MPTASKRSRNCLPARRVRRPRGYSALRFSVYAKELAKAVDAMRFRITEPVFFWGKERHAGEIMEAPVGPYRNFPTGGGLQRIPLFVEMPEEIKQTIEQAAGTPTVAPAATAVVESKPAPIKVAPKANPLAARIRALTTRRAKFQDEASAILAQGETVMTQIEANGPDILKRAHQASFDELTAITDLGSSLKEMDATNRGPLEG